METTTSDAAVIMGIVAGGIFVGLTVSIMVGTRVTARHYLVAGCTLIGVGATALIVWVLLGYDAVGT